MIKKRCHLQEAKGLNKQIIQLTYACGHQHPSDFTGNDIEMSTDVNIFNTLENLLGYKKVKVPNDL